MNETLARATRSALRHYGDAAIDEFFERLRSRSFASTRCEPCGEVCFPPRPFCPRCLRAEVRWVELPRRGRLYAFTQQQERSIRFARPDVLGLVELEGVGHVLTRIDAAFDSLRIDMEVELDFIEIGAGFVLHQFRPVSPGGCSGTQPRR
jgi:uncharacterized OB-fold protein